MSFSPSPQEYPKQPQLSIASKHIFQWQWGKVCWEKEYLLLAQLIQLKRQRGSQQKSLSLKMIFKIPSNPNHSVKLSPDWSQGIVAREINYRCTQLPHCSTKRGLMGTGALGTFPHWPEQRVAQLPSALLNSSLIQTQDTTAGTVSFQLCCRQCQASQMGTN